MKFHILMPQLKIFVIFDKNVMLTREDILAKLTAEREEFNRFGIKAIGLFGSYSKNNYSEQSDIDILVDFKADEENYDNLMSVYDRLESLFRNKKIEVVTKNGLSPYIGKFILNDVIYV